MALCAITGRADIMKDLLVHLEGSEADQLRLAHAEALASAHGAFLTGLYCNALPDIMVGGDAGFPATHVVVQLQSDAAEAGDKHEAELKKRFADLSVLNELRRMDVFSSQAGHALTAEARTFDLFIATRPYNHPDANPEPLESVLFHSGRAVLFVPPKGQPRPLDTVIVGWRNTQEAARAIAEATPLLKRAQKVVLAMVNEGEASEQDRAAPGSDIARHLDRHGIDTELRELSGWSNAAEALLNEGQKAGADLMVIGGYGHSRFRQWVLGGVTRHVLSQADIPVLSAH